ncbi:MAG: D-alanine--D-alanine ligase [Candidatus Zixiibacteriota bacterium]
MKVLVLVGGDSNERAVSLNSGAAICKALRRLGHEVLALDSGTGQLLTDSNGKLLLEGGKAPYDTPSIASCEPGALISTMSSDYRDVDVVFLALHGGKGENGSIQNLLELAGKKYTGSGMTASAVAMDKALSKRVMVSANVPTPEWQLHKVTSGQSVESVARLIGDSMPLPLIIKPNDGGSTIGLTKVTDESQVLGAVRECLVHSREVLVERYIPGRELTVTVFDGRAYPLVEIKPKSGLYDYEAKYTKGKSEYIAPADVPDALAREMQAAAVRVFEAIGCAGLARVDFILDPREKFYCLEINTLPGMTALSLAPMAFKCEGIDFDQLVAMILESALKA